jgi:hypothetical protein
MPIKRAQLLPFDIGSHVTFATRCAKEKIPRIYVVARTFMNIETAKHFVKQISDVYEKEWDSHYTEATGEGRAAFVASLRLR